MNKNQTERRHCPACSCEITSADDEAGACTNCGASLQVDKEPANHHSD